MISTEDIQLIRERFSRASARYEQLAFIQKDIRRDLLERVGEVQGRKVLDVGCGTGALLSDLCEQDPAGLPTGVDLAWGMVKEACDLEAGAHIVQADAARLPFKEGSFDLAVSSSSYQWVGDLGVSLSSVRRVLKEGGCFHAAFFSRGTLEEFWESLCNAAGRPVRLFELPTEGEVQSALAFAGFRKASISLESRETVFRDLWTLLLWLKSIGANNLGRKTFLGRQMLKKAQEYYSRHYARDNGLRVSFEVIWIEARK